MQETIKQVMEAEEKAAKIIAEAEARSNELISRNTAEISEKQNKFREEEQKRFNIAVMKAEERKKITVDNIKTAESSLSLNIDEVSDNVLKRVLKTVFD